MRARKRNLILLILAIVAGCATASQPGPEVPPEPRPKPPAEAEAEPPSPPPSLPASSPSDTAPTAPITPPSKVPWRANEDPLDNDEEGPPAPFAECASLLVEHKARYQPATQPVKPQQGTKKVCGVEQAIAFLGGPEKINWGSPVVMSCGMGIALARWEHVLNEEAERLLHRRIKSVLHGAPYQCRKITGTALPSEHSYANAIDVFGFRLADDTVISVELQFGATTSAEGTTPEAKFLRSVSRRAFEEGIFSTVLTPYFNADHRNHLHLDLGRYRADGTR